MTITFTLDLVIRYKYKISPRAVTNAKSMNKTMFLIGFSGRDFNPGGSEKAWFIPGVWRKSGEGAKIAKIRGGGVK